MCNMVTIIDNNILYHWNYIVLLKFAKRVELQCFHKKKKIKDKYVS